MAKQRVLYVLGHYPQIAETYIHSEVETLLALGDRFEVKIVGLEPVPAACRVPLPYEITDDEERIKEIVEDFKPDVIHSHWLTMVWKILARLSQQTGVPFTVRSHSFDVLEPPGRRIGPFLPPRQLNARLSGTVKAINSDLCLGVLAFPFKRPILERAGISPDKIVDTFPVVNYDRFYDGAPGGDGVMNVGAALPKKQMEDFLRLSQLVPQKQFRLYPLAYDRDQIEQKAKDTESPVEIMPAVEPTEMKPEFKKHDWLVYTASFEMNSVGWPMAVAEAQAAGLGVAVPNLRPDLREYVGDSGVLYDSIDEVVELVSEPPSDEMRERGFEQAKKSDIKEHISLLTDRWNGAR
jgi:glycosyl transferase family 1